MSLRYSHASPEQALSRAATRATLTPSRLPLDNQKQIGYYMQQMNATNKTISTPTVSDFCKGGNVAKFVQFRQGHLYYRVEFGDEALTFIIPIEDTTSATFLPEHKAIELMRWIRATLERLRDGAL